MLPPLAPTNAPGFEFRPYFSYPTYAHFLLAEGVPVFGRASLWYENQKSERTSRVVDVLRYRTDNRRTHVLAYCFLRHSYRVFDLDSMWGVRDRGDGVAQDDVLGWLQTLHGAAPLPEAPAPQEIALWTKPPVLPTLQEVHQSLLQLGTLLQAEGGDKFGLTTPQAVGPLQLYTQAMGPKARGAGSLPRADVSYRQAWTRYFSLPDGQLEPELSRWCIKPWTLYIRRTRQTRTFEHLQELRATLQEELFRSLWR